MLSEPLPYHRKIRDYFKGQSAIWSFYSDIGKKEEQHAFNPSVLFKDTYPLHSGSDPLLYEKIHITLERLGLGPLPVTAYRAMHSSVPPVRMICPPGAAHLVFSEAILQSLNEQELAALIARELAHIPFHALLDGEMETTDRIITALAGHPDSGASHFETVRRFRLYKELFCDRVAYEVLGEAGPVICLLSKLSPAQAVADVEIRGRALHLWQEGKMTNERVSDEGTAGRRGNISDLETSDGRETVAGRNGGAEAAITLLVEGFMELDRLDVLDQAVLSGMTRGLASFYLQPEWTHSPAILGLARQYFPDLAPDEEGGRGANEGHKWEPNENQGRQPSEGGAPFPDRLKTFLAGAHVSIREYFAYVLLDLALVDPDLKDLPLGRAREVAEAIGLATVLEPIVKKEMTYSNDAH